MAIPKEISWIQFGVVGGPCASVFYPLLLSAPLPLAATLQACRSLGWAREKLRRT